MEKDLRLNFLDLFAGIGGFSLGLEWAGMKCVGQVEIDDFCNELLEKHWPDVKRVKDVYDVKGDEFGAVDLICGGVPCQPASQAGKRKGKADDRWLWPEAFRIVRAVNPAWCLFENVRGLLTLDDFLVFENLLLELEGIGFEVQPFIIPACAVGAPHRRDRVWIIAHSLDCFGQSRSARKDKRGMAVEDKQYASDSCGSGCNQGCSPKSGQESGRTFPCDTDSDVNHTMRERYGEKNKIPAGGGSVISTNSHAPDTECRERLPGYPDETIGSGRQTWEEYCGGIVENSTPDTINQRLQGNEQPGTSGKRTGTPRSITECYWNENWIEVATRLCRVDARVPNRVDRLKALGNAVVPQVVEIIGKAIMVAQYGMDEAKQ